MKIFILFLLMEEVMCKRQHLKQTPPKVNIISQWKNCLTGKELRNGCYLLTRLLKIPPLPISLTHTL